PTNCAPTGSGKANANRVGTDRGRRAANPAWMRSNRPDCGNHWELTGIEPAPKIVVSCGNVDFVYTKPTTNDAK
ncbi:MAG TPA: hypothetical protein VE197_19695, partial [Mycobacterium sp.]|nr:hypothetical protein [Mycobacterium sp.]